MQAGRLRNKVKLQALADVQDELGQPVQTWADVATVWADIRTMGGIESIKANASTSIIKASIRVRYRTDINAGMRVLHGSTAYDIKAVLPDEGRKQYVDLVCEIAA